MMALSCIVYIACIDLMIMVADNSWHFIPTGTY